MVHLPSAAARAARLVRARARGYLRPLPRGSAPLSMPSPPLGVAASVAISVPWTPGASGARLVWADCNVDDVVPSDLCRDQLSLCDPWAARASCGLPPAALCGAVPSVCGAPRLCFDPWRNWKKTTSVAALPPPSPPACGVPGFEELVAQLAAQRGLTSALLARIEQLEIAIANAIADPIADGGSDTQLLVDKALGVRFPQLVATVSDLVIGANEKLIAAFLEKISAARATSDEPLCDISLGHSVTGVPAGSAASCGVCCSVCCSDVSIAVSTNDPRAVAVAVCGVCVVAADASSVGGSSADDSEDDNEGANPDCEVASVDHLGYYNYSFLNGNYNYFDELIATMEEETFVAELHRFVASCDAPLSAVTQSFTYPTRESASVV